MSEAPTRNPHLIARDLNEKMQAARDELKAVMGVQQYADVSRQVQLVIMRVARQNQVDTLVAIDMLSKAALARGDNNMALMTCAAGFDILEPEGSPPRTTVLHT
ncbi:MAG: hypothetical protein ACREO0_10905 [Pseudoxanthomonas sp.]